MSLNASVGPFDTCSRCSPGSSVRHRRDLVAAEHRRGVGAVDQRRQVGGRDVVDEARQHRERELGVGQRRAAPRARPASNARIGSRHGEPAVGRQALEQDRRERLRRVAPGAAGADVAHGGLQFSSSRRIRTTEPRTVGSASIAAIAAATCFSIDRWVSRMMSVCVLALGRLLLDHRVDRDVAVGEDARDVGEHAGPVVDAHAAGSSWSRPRPSAGTARRRAGRAGTRGAARGARGRRCACASRRRGRRSPRSRSARRRRRRRSRASRRPRRP